MAGAGGESGSGGEAPGPYREPQWLGACTPVDLSADGNTVLATRGLWTAASGWITLPDLPGGSVSNEPLALSRDGRVVFGASSSALGVELYRYSEATGIVGLGRIREPESSFGTNEDGSVLVGWSRENTAGELAPFAWTLDGGFVDVDEADCRLPDRESYSAFAADAGSPWLFAAGMGFDEYIPKHGYCRCWGRGDSGQLGNGQTLDSGAPVAVVGITSAVQLAAGKAHACALHVDGTIECTGSRGSGALGDAQPFCRANPESASRTFVVAVRAG